MRGNIISMVDILHIQKVEMTTKKNSELPKNSELKRLYKLEEIVLKRAMTGRGYLREEEIRELQTLRKRYKNDGSTKNNILSEMGVRVARC